MTQEALKLALEALERGETELRWKAINIVKEALAQHDSVQAKPEPEQKPVEVKFPRHEKQSEDNWTIDPAFIARVKQSIDPETPWDFIPEMEQVETTLLALEVIPSNLYTTPPQGIYYTPPQRTWVGLTDEEMLEAIKPLYTNPFLAHNALEIGRDEYQAIEAKLKQKNGYAEENT